MRTLTIKLDSEQAKWLEDQAHALKRSKGSIVRDLIARQQSLKGESLAEALGDLCGSQQGSKDLSTRSLKGYGRS